jgi:hypothetical protein
MYKIPNEPWENINMVYDAVMTGKAFSYLEKDFNNIYEKFILEKEQIFKKHEEDGDWERYTEIAIYNDLFIILGCAMIEFWVNSFGIHLLNEEYYKKNIERLSIVEKIRILIAIHKREEIDDNNENVKNIRELFENRNSLIHPKAKRPKVDKMEEFVFEPNKVNNDDYLFVKKTLKNVYNFFKENEIVPEIGLYFE